MTHASTKVYSLLCDMHTQPGVLSYPKVRESGKFLSAGQGPPRAGAWEGVGPAWWGMLPAPA